MVSQPFRFFRVKIRLQAENQLPRLPGSAFKVPVVGVGSYPLLSLAPTHVEVELGCDNNHHLISHRRDCPRVMKFCMRPSVTKRIRLHKFLIPPLHPHYDMFWGELYFSSRRGCPRVLKFCMQPSVTQRIRLHP